MSACAPGSEGSPARGGRACSVRTPHVRVRPGVRASPSVGRGVLGAEAGPVADPQLAVESFGPFPPFAPVEVSTEQTHSLPRAPVAPPAREVGERWGERGAGEGESGTRRLAARASRGRPRAGKRLPAPRAAPRAPRSHPGAGECARRPGPPAPGDAPVPSAPVHPSRAPRSLGPFRPLGGRRGRGPPSGGCTPGYDAPRTPEDRAGTLPRGGGRPGNTAREDRRSFGGAERAPGPGHSWYEGPEVGGLGCGRTRGPW